MRDTLLNRSTFILTHMATGRIQSRSKTRAAGKVSPFGIKISQRINCTVTKKLALMEETETESQAVNLRHIRGGGGLAASSLTFETSHHVNKQVLNQVLFVLIITFDESHTMLTHREQARTVNRVRSVGKHDGRR